MLCALFSRGIGWRSAGLGSVIECVILQCYGVPTAEINGIIILNTAYFLRLPDLDTTIVRGMYANCKVFCVIMSLQYAMPQILLHILDVHDERFQKTYSLRANSLQRSVYIHPFLYIFHQTMLYSTLSVSIFGKNINGFSEHYKKILHPLSTTSLSKTCTANLYVTAG